MAKSNSSRGTRRRGHLNDNRPRAGSGQLGQKKSKAGQTRSNGGRRQSRPDWDQILGLFSNALAVVETACTALEATQDDQRGRAGPAILTLGKGLKALERIYTDFDLAISALPWEVRHG